MLDNIRIVLINTFHPGNIGAAARAMKNMGLSSFTWLIPGYFQMMKRIQERRVQKTC